MVDGLQAALVFQSTLPGWGATAVESSVFSPFLISIHAPRMGSDKSGSAHHHTASSFQSTLPGWGATLSPIIAVD